MDSVALGSHGARRGGLRRAGLALRKPGPAASGPRRRTRLRTPTGAPRVSHESHAPHRGRGPGRSFNLPESRLSKSVAKARIGPKRRKRNVDIPRFFSRPIPARSAFATDLDTSPPQTVPEAPPAPPRAGRLFARESPVRRRGARGPWRPRPPPLLRDQCRSGGAPPGRARDRRHSLGTVPGSPGGSGSTAPALAPPGARARRPHPTPPTTEREDISYDDQEGRVAVLAPGRLRPRRPGPGGMHRGRGEDGGAGHRDPVGSDDPRGCECQRADPGRVRRDHGAPPAPAGVQRHLHQLLPVQEPLADHRGAGGTAQRRSAPDPPPGLPLGAPGLAHRPRRHPPRVAPGREVGRVHGGRGPRRHELRPPADGGVDQGDEGARQPARGARAAVRPAPAIPPAPTPTATSSRTTSPGCSSTRWTSSTP